MVGAAPPERAGAAAGISETSSEFGGALGIALLGAVGTAVYRGQIDDAVSADVTSDAAEVARDTLGAAVAAGDELPAGAAAELVNAAQDAFTQALQLAATLSAMVAIGAAIVALALLRQARTQSELDEERGGESDRALTGGRPC
jgi:MFS transporter, DHA2 family, multidrug resistance protein